VVLYHLMALASNAAVPEQVRAITFGKLVALRTFLESGKFIYQTKYFISQIKSFENNPKEVNVPKPVEPPPGQPIGCDWN
jgi:hypothetical protein